MALKVIGSGLGRTGTMSTKLALQQILGPCHHMMEVFTHPESIPLWVEAGRGNPDWDAIFRDYVAMVDHPGCAYFEQLMHHYPDAKVLHTVRDPDKWFDSTQATIFNPDRPAPPEGTPMRTFFDQLYAWYGGDMHDRGFMTDFFRRHTERVVASVPPERLLVFDVKDGWDPLCAFLGVPVPETPYPRENTTEQFQARSAEGPPIDPALLSR